MSNAKHTPGPWIARGTGTHWVQTPGARGSVICHVSGNPDRTEEQEAVDAALIAAAPDLLFFARRVAVALPGELGALIHEAHTLIARTEIQS